MKLTIEFESEKEVERTIKLIKMLHYCLEIFETGYIGYDHYQLKDDEAILESLTEQIRKNFRE